jgi:hypothetical protein
MLPPGHRVQAVHSAMCAYVADRLDPSAPRRGRPRAWDSNCWFAGRSIMKSPPWSSLGSAKFPTISREQIRNPGRQLTDTDVISWLAAPPETSSC